MDGLQILKIYKDAHKENILKKLEEKVKEVRENNEFVKNFRETVENFTKALDEIFLSQFENGVADECSGSTKPVPIKKSSFNVMSPQYVINENYVSDDEISLKEKAENELIELDRKCASCAAMLNICKTKEEFEDILVKYDIIDKKAQIQFPKNK